MASPPHIPQINAPRKRGSISSLSGAPAKKRKPSALRNAYSPETESAGSPLRFSRSPSLESVATNSVINGAGGKRRRRKGDDTASVVSSARGGRGAKGGNGSLAGGEDNARNGDGEGEYDEPDDEEDYDMGEDTDMKVEGGMSAGERRKLEKDHERMLMEFMTPAQADRYATYRRTRLKKETIRKLVNQTLSQSVPQPIIIAVTSYTKSFIGELIDRALTVRDEHAIVATHLPNGALPPAVLAQSLQRPSAHIKVRENRPMGQDQQQAGLWLEGKDKEEGIWREVDGEAGLEERLRGGNKGPLTPAHVREALRRYKRDREGGGAGFAGMSLEGVERGLGRVGGKRLFR